MIDQISSVNSALGYNPVAIPRFIDAAPLTNAPGAASPNEFSSMLGQMISNTAQELQKAEATSIAAIKGKANIQDVVETVMAAEHTLQAAIAVRDKVTSAYLELSRMAI